MENARKFLARVVPWSEDGWISIHPAWRRGDRRGIGNGQAFKDLNAAANYVEWLRDKVGSDMYVCMSALTAVETKTNKAGRQFHVATRREEFVRWLRSIWLDLDLQSSHSSDKVKGFPTKQALAAAFQKFLRESGLPMPSVMVWTGNGFHCHWVFEDPLPPHEWQVLADALRAATKHFLLTPIDDGLITNPVCVLRIPDTYNWKADLKKSVSLMHWGEVYAVDRIRAVLAPFIGAAPTPTAPRVPGQSLLGPAFPVKPPLPFDMRERYPELGFQGSIDDVAGVCPFIAETLESGGAGHSEALWRQSLAVAYYTSDPTDAAYRLSLGYDGSSEAEVDKKLGEIEKYRRERSLGWPRCQTIHRDGATQCATCPHLAAAKTPFHFVNVAPPPQPVDLKVNGHGEAPLSGPNDIVVPKVLGDLPADYRHDERGIVWAKVDRDPDKPGPDEEIVCPLPIFNVQKQRQRDDGVGEYAISFDTRLDRTNWKRIYVPYEVINDGRALFKALSKQGFLVDAAYHRRVSKLMSAFTEQLFAALQVATPSELLGWSEEDGKFTGFVYANKRHGADGERTVGAPNQKISQMYRPTGSFDVWRRAVKLITDQKSPALDALLAVSFGAPLVVHTGHTGLVVNAWSLATGISKSSACRVGQAVWTQPTLGMSKADDTANSLTDKMGILRHLPVYFDDYQQQGPKLETHLVQMIFGMGQGRAKERMTRSLERAPVNAFATLLCTTSNSPLVDFVADHTAMTEAGVYRVFSCAVAENVTGTGLVNIAEATHVIGSLDSNYGHAGEIVASYYGKNAAKVAKEVKAFYVGLCERLKTSQKERFWIATMAVIYMGAHYSNQLGLTDIDLKELYRFLQSTLLRMRRDRNILSQDYTKSDTVLDKVSAYVLARRQQTVVTDKIWQQPGTPPWQINLLCDASRLQGRLAVRVVRDDKLLRMSKKDFITWGDKETVHGHGKMLARMLVEQGIAKQVRDKTIAAHVGHALTPGAQEVVLDFDLGRYPQLYVFD